MSDLLFPKDILIHEDYIIHFVNCLRYEVIPGHGFTFIYASDKGPGGKWGDARPHAKIPGEYFFHIRRFLWRYYLFAAILNAKKRLKLQKSFILFLEKMIVMLDIALEQLVYPCSQMQRGQLKVNQRFPLFDIYLTTEFVVGYHDPTSVDKWRMHSYNDAKDLERMDPFKFDWNSYDNALGDMLSGEATGYDVDEIRGDMLEQMAIAVGQWYDVPIRSLTKAQRTAQDKKPRLVNGSPGLGVLFMDCDAGGYDLGDEMSVEEWDKDVEKEAKASENAEKAAKGKKATNAPKASKQRKAPQVPQMMITTRSNRGK